MKAEGRFKKTPEEKERVKKLKTAKENLKKLRIAVEQSGECAICCDNPPDCVFTRCGHPICHNCAKTYTLPCYACKLPIVSDRCQCGAFFDPSDTFCNACSTKEISVPRTVWSKWKCGAGHMNEIEKNKLPTDNKCALCELAFKPFELAIEPYHRVYLSLDYGLNTTALDDLLPDKPMREVVEILDN